MYSKTIIAIVATANAIKLDTEAEFIPGVGDIPILGDIVGGIGNFGENLWNSATGIWDYTTSGDGLTSDLKYVFSKDFGNDLLSVGDSIITGEVFEEAWDWMSEDGGENWLALGKVALATGMAVGQGDILGAWDTVTNECLYDEDCYDPETHYRKAYEDYLKKFKSETLPNARTNIQAVIDQKTARCASHEPKIKGEAYSFFGMSLNTSQKYMMDIGEAPMNKFFEMFENRSENSFTAEKCYAEDCLHSCYGAEHESYCS